MTSTSTMSAFRGNHGAQQGVHGAAREIVMQLRGWKTEKMMRRYAAVTAVTLRAAAEEAVSGSEPIPAVRSLGL